MTHAKVWSEQNQYLLEYGGRQRQLIWDESMLVTRPVTVNLITVAQEAAVWLVKYNAVRKRQAHGSTLTHNDELLAQYLRQLSAVLHDIDPDVNSYVALPAFHGHLSDIDWTWAGRNDATLLKLLEALKTNSGYDPDRGFDDVVIGVHKPAYADTALLSFVVQVPDALRHVVIMDASSPIRKLVRLDKGITQVPLNVTKDYSQVRIHYSTAFSAGKHTNKDEAKARPFLDELSALIRRRYSGQGIVLFKIADESIDIEGKFRRVLDDPHAERLLRFVSWGKANGVKE